MHHTFCSSRRKVGVSALSQNFTDIWAPIRRLGREVQSPGILFCTDCSGSQDSNMEHLTMHSRTRQATQRQTGRLHSWSFVQLQSFITYSQRIGGSGSSSLTRITPCKPALPASIKLAITVVRKPSFPVASVATLSMPISTPRQEYGGKHLASLSTTLAGGLSSFLVPSREEQARSL